MWKSAARRRRRRPRPGASPLGARRAGRRPDGRWRHRGDGHRVPDARRRTRRDRRRGGDGFRPGHGVPRPGEEFAELPPLQGLHTHAFRWDHAIAFARWALGDACPTDITVFLIEVAGVEYGAELSEPVTTGMGTVIDVIERDFLAPLRPAKATEVTVEFTGDGYLRLDAALAASRFASDAVAAVVQDDDFLLIPLRGPRSGGLLLKQRNPAGDRSALIHEVLYGRIPVGVQRAFWDEERGALRVPLRPVT